MREAKGTMIVVLKQGGTVTVDCGVKAFMVNDEKKTVSVDLEDGRVLKYGFARDAIEYTVKTGNGSTVVAGVAKAGAKAAERFGGEDNGV